MEMIRCLYILLGLSGLIGKSMSLVLRSKFTVFTHLRLTFRREQRDAASISVSINRVDGSLRGHSCYFPVVVVVVV